MTQSTGTVLLRDKKPARRARLSKVAGAADSPSTSLLAAWLGLRLQVDVEVEVDSLDQLDEVIRRLERR